MVADAGGGSGSGDRWTNWNDKDVPTMWGYVSGLVIDPIWTHSAGWTKTYELANVNLWRLRDFRAKLTEVWPPERNEAARAYVAKLDELIANVSDVHETAMTNHRNCADIALSLSEAKRLVGPLYQEWVTLAGRQADYDRRHADYKDQLLDKYSSPQSTGYKQSLGYWEQRNPNPAVAGRQAEITAEVRRHMWTVSADVGSAGRRMVPPPPYVPPRGAVNDGGSDDGGYGGGYGGAGLIPPFIPAPVPLSGLPTGAAPVLSGTTPGPLSPPATLPPTSTPGVPGLPGGPVLPGLPGLPGGVIGGPAQPGIIAGGRANPVGGVIGGGAGGTRPAGAARTANPVGGVIGGGGARTAATAGPIGGGRTAGAPVGGVGGGRAGRRGEDETARTWDPDNPWEVAEGVAPVVAAPAEWGPVDPGPAIGGTR